MRQFGFVWFILIAGSGCRDVSAPFPTEAPERSTTVSTKFDASTCGTIAGRVRWTGALPQVPPIKIERLDAVIQKTKLYSRPNPHAPQIDPTTNGVGGLVVFLRGVAPELARPWDHAPVTVVMHDEQPLVRQGENAPGLVGIVRRGDDVTLVSGQPIPHSLRARGAAFFTLTLPEPNKLRRRAFHEVGRVELTSANGHIAMRGHLFVDDHPYYAVTNSTGQFQMPHVPAGNYELVCWRPDWRIDRQERDPESLTFVRMTFVLPKETSLPVTVRAGDTATVVMEVGAD
jgi:hypothetical protein